MIYFIIAAILTLNLFVGPLAAQVSGPTLRVQWTDRSTNEIGFSIERATGNASSPFTEIAIVPTDTIQFIDSTISKDTVYCYKVRAYNERVESSQTTKQYSDYSNISCGSRVDIPETPTDLLTTAHELLSRAQDKIAEFLAVTN